MTAPTGELATYEELAGVLTNLPLLLREARRARRLSLRAAGDEICVAASTVMRIENGDECSLASAVAVLRWMDLDHSPSPGTGHSAVGGKPEGRT